MARTLTTAGTSPVETRSIRRIGVEDVTESLRLGWRDFMRRPSAILFLFIVYPVIGAAAFVIAFQSNLVGLIYPLAAGFALVGPVASVGVLELSRRMERGEEPRLPDAFSVLSSPSRGAILKVALLLFALFAAWIVTAELILRATLGEVRMDDLGAFLALAISSVGGLAMFVIGNAVGFAFALAALAIGAVSFPLMVDGERSATTAVATSIRACLENPVPMAVWGLAVAVLLALGSIPVFAGLVVVLPVLGHANWHLYRRLIER